MSTKYYYSLVHDCYMQIDFLRNSVTKVWYQKSSGFYLFGIFSHTENKNGAMDRIIENGDYIEIDYNEMDY